VPSTTPPGPLCYAFTFKKDLKSGAQGDDVKQLQVFLNTHGSLVAASGPGSQGKETTSFGAAVKKALAAFQKANKLKADGIFAGKTRELIQSMMKKVVCPKPLLFPRDLKSGAQGDDVKQLQVFLNTHGSLVAASGPGSQGKETTSFGAAVKKALAAFQKANKLKADGIFAGKTRELVRKLMEKK
jgi:peptidoglycan hydrolase-like protein with peptidoglycan-binding domain